MKVRTGDEQHVQAKTGRLPSFVWFKYFTALVLSRVGFIKSYLTWRTYEATTINERFIAMGPKSYGVLDRNSVFILGRIQSKTSAPQENEPRKWLTINSSDKNHVYSIVKNIQVLIPLFCRYV